MKRTVLTASAAVVAVVALGSVPANAADTSGWDGIYVSQNAIKTNSGSGYMLMIDPTATVFPAADPKIGPVNINPAEWAWVATPQAVDKVSIATAGQHGVVGPISVLKDKSKAFTVKRLANGNLQIVDCLGTVPKVTKANAKDMCLLVKVTAADLDKLH